MSLHSAAGRPTGESSQKNVAPNENAGARRGRRADGSRQRWYSSITARVFLIALSLLFLLPLYWMIASALKGNEEMAMFPPSLWPETPLWENFSAAVNVMPFWLFFRNTTVITVASVLLAVLANFIVAYGFACIEWRGRDRLFYILLATLFLPFPVTLIPMFDLWANLGLVNTWAPLILPNMFASAFYTFLLRQFLMQVPKDMLSAARVDGASEWRIAWRIVFPSALPALTAVGIFAAVGAWNDFMGPLIYLQETDVQTLSIGMQMFRMTNSEDIQFNLLMAASFLVILPLIILFFIFQRFFIRGITIGGFK